MKHVKIATALMAFSVTGMLFAANYNAPDVRVGDTSPKYRPTKPVMYEDSYHIAGVSWGNDRTIASESEAEREPSSVPVAEPKEPTPWLHKEEADRKY